MTCIFLTSTYLYLQPLRTNSNFVPLLDTEVDTSSCTSSSSESDELSDDDGIAFGPYPSGLFYDEENTNLNPRYGLDRDNSGACECEVRYAAY